MDCSCSAGDLKRECREGLYKNNMKKTFRWITAAVVFLMTGIILFTHISDVLRKKTGNASDMIHSFYSLDKNTLDVLCMGSSHGYSSFQPNLLWKEYGVTSYVMCSPRQTAANTYYLLKEALRYQKPQILLLETYYFFTNKKYTTEAILRTSFDGLALCRAKYEMIEDILPNIGVKAKLTWYLPFLKYHSRWTELKEWDFHSDAYLKGSVIDFEVCPMEEPELPSQERALPENVRSYLDKIIALCEENGIELVAYTAPYGYIEEEKAYFVVKQEINLALEAYLKERGVPYFNLQRSDDLGIDFASDFRDHTHLNSVGAGKVTRYLSEFLVKNYDLQDHRGEDAYSSWDDDYEKFRQAEMSSAGKK